MECGGKRSATPLSFGHKSGMGLSHSKTLPRSIARHSLREVLECGCPMPLSPPFNGRPDIFLTRIGTMN